MPEIAEWLQQLGFGQYAQRFTENDVDFRVLPELTEQDLKELGVSLGHRRLILRAIAELSSTGKGKLNAADTTQPAYCVSGKRRAPPSHGDVLRFGRFNGAIDPHGP